MRKQYIFEKGKKRNWKVSGK